ncbi:hypothetical protein A1O1_02345 [Capronia coronata CBS 617.96]|uniref:Uncharacterized protein n=1 Tax=Capronia coronata CBS 617.96 TaxID=1182541 RepID=W9YM32_9EURO|nr:uncharacterized protein A1O1_02345 [Capronia coronata CBS 617.96]EXJ93952.1 hypothetical protein A1O1_02345 [Capronia coronata CBS 617.96]
MSLEKSGGLPEVKSICRHRRGWQIRLLCCECAVLDTTHADVCWTQSPQHFAASEDELKTSVPTNLNTYTITTFNADDGVSHWRAILRPPSPTTQAEISILATPEELQSETSDNTIDSSLEYQQSSLLDCGALREHYAHLQVLADQVRAAHMTVTEEEACITAALKTLWDENPDLRRRGLKGGTARTAKKMKGPYTPINKMTKEQKHRRLHVEKQDKRVRGGIERVRLLQELLDSSLKLVEYQAGECEMILGREGLTKDYGAEPLSCDVELVNNILGGEMFGLIQEVEVMMETYYEEIYTVSWLEVG